MTDRELLELAGLAAGQTFDADNNPLERDDLALRLAVKLKFDIMPGETSVLVFCSRNHPQRFQEEEEFGGDPAAATRRAIVRAAAALAPTPSDSSQDTK